MKWKKIIIPVIWGMIFLAANTVAGEETADKSPSAFIPEPVYTFEPVVEGAKIVHDFILQNKGSETLVIENLKSGLGCTAASGEKQISPGGETKITVKVSTKGFGGRNITETVWIYTNDGKNPQLQIRVTGSVEAFADIVPKRVTLVGAVGTPLKTQIRIVPRQKYPFKILSTRARNGKFITFQVEEQKESEKAMYVLTVENTAQQKGRYSDAIYMETDNKIRPVIEIPVMGNILIPAAAQTKP